MREQASGANLLHESVSGASSLVCTEICLSWTDLSPVGQSNWLILSFRAVHRHVGVLTRKQVSGASSLVCTGLYSVMQIMTAKSTLGTLYAHVVLHSAIFPQILCIVLYAAHVLPIKFFSNYYFNKLFRATAKCDKNRWITRVNSTSTGINGVRLAYHISNARMVTNHICFCFIFWNSTWKITFRESSEKNSSATFISEESP